MTGMDMDRFCKDCRFFRRSVFAPQQEFCHRPREGVKPDPVTGEIAPMLCRDEREVPDLVLAIRRCLGGDACGKQGKFFQPSWTEDAATFEALGDVFITVEGDDGNG